MKKKKLLKSASLVALSAVMMCGAAVSFAACGGDDAYTISISMFCGDSDTDVNRQNCNDWAEYYTNVLRENGTFSEEEAIKIKFSSQSDTDAYFTALSNQMGSNSMPNVFYVSPKYVKNWSKMGKIIDMSSALATYKEELTGIWEDSLAFYSYSSDPNYNSGDRVHFDESKNAFVTDAAGVKVGIYGLPKDYSNFGLGFNEVFFTPEIREAMTTKTTNQRDGVKGAEYESAKITYNNESGVITSDPEGTTDVPLVNIGKPTWYRPYNFYRFASYTDAVNGGDPMACAVDYYTGGAGYCVTIPGWPGDTFQDAKADAKTKDNPWKSVADDKLKVENPDTAAAYDAEQGYVTYTYAEYSALTWVMTYYLNTYNWQGNGKGGARTATTIKNVYGNDQYDGVLYLLPWLAGNNAQYLNKNSTKATSASETEKTYKQTKRDIHGEDNEVDINWGIDNDEFLEVVGAFYAYGSDWNGNSNNAGDTPSEKSSGWDLFVAGNCVFYGVGTWNAGALNATDRTYLKYRLMPEPVSEDYALASLVKDQDYNMRGYGSIEFDSSAYSTNFKRGTSDAGTFASCVNVKKDTFTGEDIVASQIERQDKWGARMDSVGYGVSGLITNGASWRKDAAIDLVRYLTIEPTTQVTLTYAGSQLPNFKKQCQDFYKHEGDFEDMVTPEDSTWDATYTIAKDMFAASATDKNTTVGAYLANKTVGTAAVNYDHAFENAKLSTLLNLSYAMKILKMVAYKKADRDLSLRMQYGLNAVRDSAMYTYNDNWLDVLDGRGKGFLMVYTQQTPYPVTTDSTGMPGILDRMFYKADATTGDKVGRTPTQGQSYGTPAWFYAYSAEQVQKELDNAIRLENG